jgi:hypothetical protein
LDIQAFISANTGILLAVSLILAMTALIVVVFLIREVRQLRQPFRNMAKLYETSGSEKALSELLKGVDENRRFMQEQAGELKRIFGMLDRDLCNLGLIKYNAFEDIGGNQSYSLCILTREKNGFILTNLVGRNSTRGYAVEVTGAVPSRRLSDEEQEVLDTAVKATAAVS